VKALVVEHSTCHHKFEGLNPAATFSEWKWW